MRRAQKMRASFLFVSREQAMTNSPVGLAVLAALILRYKRHVGFETPMTFSVSDQYSAEHILTLFQILNIQYRRH